MSKVRSFTKRLDPITSCKSRRLKIHQHFLWMPTWMVAIVKIRFTQAFNCVRLESRHWSPPARSTCAITANFTMQRSSLAPFGATMQGWLCGGLVIHDSSPGSCATNSPFLTHCAYGIVYQWLNLYSSKAFHHGWNIGPRIVSWMMVHRHHNYTYHLASG